MAAFSMTGRACRRTRHTVAGKARGGQSGETKRMKVLIALLLLPVLASSAHSAEGDLNWLVGCWVSPDKSGQEVWVVDGDRTLIGFSVALSAAEVVFYELLSIRQNDDGSWTYTAHPSGQASAAFIAVEAHKNSVVFVNPNHDYPQQIKYLRDGNRLYASVSLLGGNKLNSFDKIACD
jgi:hypothetical protein